MNAIIKQLRPYQKMIISVSIILFCVIGVLFAAFPAIRKTQEMARAVKQLSSETDILSKKLEILNTLDEETLRSQLSDALSAVPSERSFPTLFETVESVALQTGVILQSMSMSGGMTLATPSASKVSAAEKKIGSRTISFSVVVEGSREMLQQFISLAPRVRRLLRINTFSITFPKSTSPLTVLTIEIEMDGFYEPLPTTLGKTNISLPTLTEQDQITISTLSQFPLATAESSELPPPLIGKVKDNPFSP